MTPATASMPGEHEGQPDQLPRHDKLGFTTRMVEWLCLGVASLLLVTQIGRLALSPQVWQWWMLPTVIAAMVTADFVSGLVHWTADTWFAETMPVLGRRFLRPFRVHHVNPDDFLRRDFVDTNGDVAMLTIPFLSALFWVPLDMAAGPVAALFIVAFSATALPTNQVHQWAHMPDPPPIVRWLQQWNLILSRAQHQRHHTAPYVTNYCIALGWCNIVLGATQFFPRLERLISWLTGLQPRSDDSAFQFALESRLGANESKSP